MEDVQATDDPLVSRGLKFAGIASLVYIIVLVVAGAMVPGLLLNEDMSLGGSPLLKGVVPILFFLLCIAGISYGIGSKHILKEEDISNIIGKSLAGMGSYLAMAFTAAQFTSLFNWTNMGTVLSIKGARALETSGFDGAPLFITFIVFVVLLDFLITSSSAKWTILAPIFVPMFSYLGYHPAFSQTAYRIGDAGANIIGPLNVFLWMLLDICQERYDEDLQIGDFLSSLFVFFIVSQIGFIILLMVFLALELPVGPGMPVYL